MNAADAEREERADERGPEIDGRVRHAPEAELAQQRLGDETEALRASGQRADHRRGGDEDDETRRRFARAGTTGGAVLERRSGSPHRCVTLGGKADFGNFATTV